MSVGFASIIGGNATSVTSGNVDRKTIQQGWAGRGFTLVFHSLKIMHIVTFIHLFRTFDHFEEIHDVFLELSV
jgi:hypothetical protein